MPTLTELNNSRLQIAADGITDRSSATFEYVAQGCADEAAVLALVKGGSGAPLTYGTMNRRNIEIKKRLKEDTWLVEVKYIDFPATLFSYDATAGTQHITNSIATISKYAIPDKTAQDYKGAIGVDSEGTVNGVDKVQPQFQWQEIHYYTEAQIADPFLANLYTCEGTVNKITWQGYTEAEVLFMGATGVKREGDNGLWEFTYKFMFSPTVSGKTIGAMTGIAKKGWEYLWIYYQKSVSNGLIVMQPYSAYVEQVYDETDFLALLGF